VINRALDEMQGAIQRHYYDLQGAGEVISAGKIKMRLCSTDEKANMSIGKLFDLFITDYEQLVLTQDYGHESFFRYKVCKDRVMHFISMNYKTSDLPLDQHRQALPRQAVPLSQDRARPEQQHCGEVPAPLLKCL
jgi:hypothetical protein